MKKLTVLVFMIMLVSAVFAQDAAQTETGSLEDELFGGDTEALVTPEQANAETQKDGVSLTGDLKTATFQCIHHIPGKFIRKQTAAYGQDTALTAFFKAVFF